MKKIWIVVGEWHCQPKEIVSVWGSEKSANAAAGKIRTRPGKRYDVVSVECYKVQTDETHN